MDSQVISDHGCTPAMFSRTWYVAAQRSSISIQSWIKVYIVIRWYVLHLAVGQEAVAPTTIASRPSPRNDLCPACALPFFLPPPPQPPLISSTRLLSWLLLCVAHFDVVFYHVCIVVFGVATGFVRPSRLARSNGWCAGSVLADGCASTAAHAVCRLLLVAWLPARGFCGTGVHVVRSA